MAQKDDKLKQRNASTKH